MHTTSSSCLLWYYCSALSENRKYSEKSSSTSGSISSKVKADTKNIFIHFIFVHCCWDFFPNLLWSETVQEWLTRQKLKASLQQLEVCDHHVSALSHFSLIFSLCFFSTCASFIRTCRLVAWIFELETQKNEFRVCKESCNLTKRQSIKWKCGNSAEKIFRKRRRVDSRK